MRAQTQAIESEQLSTLEDTVREMKELKHGSSAPLHTCRVIENSGVAYSMTLLALCGFHGRKEMVDLLLQEEAGIIYVYILHCPCMPWPGALAKLPDIWPCHGRESIPTDSITFLPNIILRWFVCLQIWIQSVLVQCMVLECPYLRWCSTALSSIAMTSLKSTCWSILFRKGLNCAEW